MLKLQVRDQLMMRNKIRQILWLLCCLPVLTGCIGEDDYANDPRGNFEQLWKIIDEQYCFLDTKGIDWDAVHDEYSKLIIPSMSNDDLFDILSQMLYILKDGHVNLSSASRISYYEIFSLGNSSGVIKFTSLHNQPSLRQMLSVDLPIGYTKMRFSYLADLQQSNVNNIKTHTYSHVFMVGFVKDLYRIRNKKGTALPSSVRAY